MKHLIKLFSFIIFFSTVQIAFAVEEDKQPKTEISTNIEEGNQQKINNSNSVTTTKEKLTFKEKRTLKKQIKELFSPENINKTSGAENIIAFILGFLLGLIGVLITFLVFYNNSARKDIMLNAWLGFLIWVVLFVVLSA